jgi:KDO2-lipid IV(A) lauroyltransferase
MRRDRGLTLMPLTGAGGTYEFLKDNLLSGKVIALVGDRDVGGNGMSNEFFGHRAVLPIGAAMLAVDTGLPLFTCSTWYDGDTLVIDFDDEVKYPKEQVTGRDRLRKAQEITSTIAKRFEKHISSHPENWHQLQPIWPDLVAVKK